MAPSAFFFAAYAMAFLPLLLPLLVRPSLAVSTTCTSIAIVLIATTHHFNLKTLEAHAETRIQSSQFDPLIIVLTCFALGIGALIYHLRRD